MLILSLEATGMTFLRVIAPMEIFLSVMMKMIINLGQLILSRVGLVVT